MSRCLVFALLLVVAMSISLLLFVWQPTLVISLPSTQLPAHQPIACAPCKDYSPTACSCGDVDQIELLQLRTANRLLRSMVTEVICKPGLAVSPTGGWCLRGAPNALTMPNGIAIPQQHLPADPGLAQFLGRFFDGKRVLDMGAGVGQYEAWWKNANVNVSAVALDGALNVEEWTNGAVLWADFTQPLYVHQSPFDWVMCLEVGEHIPKAFQSMLLRNIDQHNRCGVVLSWAIPGQGGHSHINLLPNSEVIQEMSSRGYVYDNVTSMIGRQAAEYWWFKNTLMVFCKANAKDCQMACV